MEGAQLDVSSFFTTNPWVSLLAGVAWIVLLPPAAHTDSCGRDLDPLQHKQTSMAEFLVTGVAPTHPFTRRGNWASMREVYKQTGHPDSSVHTCSSKVYAALCQAPTREQRRSCNAQWTTASGA